MYITQLLPPTLSSLPAIFILKHLLDRDCSTVLPANRYGAALISTKNAEARPQLRCTLFLLHKVTAHCLLCLRESSSRGVHLYLSNVFLLPCNTVPLFHPSASAPGAPRCPTPPYPLEVQSRTPSRCGIRETSHLITMTLIESFEL